MPDQASRVLVIESGDDWRVFSVPADWDTDDVDRYLNGMAYGRAAVVTVEEIPASWQDEGEDRDSFLPMGAGEYGGGSV